MTATVTSLFGVCATNADTMWYESYVHNARNKAEKKKKFCNQRAGVRTVWAECLSKEATIYFFRLIF